MRIVEAIGIGVLFLLGILILIFVRREVISHAGTIDMSIRLTTLVPGRGWAPGLGRFVGDELRWYRVFSLGFRPRRVLSRHGLEVQGRRVPGPEERLALPDGWVVVRCTGPGEPVEIALAEQALTGFLSWLESAPPGAVRR